jgi:hypothetical protein
MFNITQLAAEFFFHRPFNITAITANVLEILGKRNIRTDFSTDATESFDCIETLTAVAESHFDAAFGDEKDAYSQHRFKMFRDFWKSYHADISVSEGNLLFILNLHNRRSYIFFLHFCYNTIQEEEDPLAEENKENLDEQGQNENGNGDNEEAIRKRKRLLGVDDSSDEDI